MWRYEVYADTTTANRWRLWDGDGNHVASSGESFFDHSNALRAARHFRDNCSAWRYSVLVATDGRFYWHAQAANNEKVAWSGGFHQTQAAAQGEQDRVKRYGGSGTGV